MTPRLRKLLSVLNLVGLTAFLGLGAVLAFVLAQDYIASRDERDCKVVYGTVVSEEAVRFYGFIKRPKVWIEADGGNQRHFAVLQMDRFGSMPKRVSFCQKTAPNTEVALREETSSLLGAMLIALCLLGVIVGLLWQRKRAVAPP